MVINLNKVMMASLLTKYIGRSCISAFSISSNSIPSKRIIQQSAAISTRLYSEQPTGSTSTEESTENLNKDASIASKARTPFTAPSSAFDDSMPTNFHDTDQSSPDLEWSKLGLTSDLAIFLSNDASANGMGFKDGPTPVQKMAIPAILAGCASFLDVHQPSPSEGGKSKVQSIAFAAATGSGKTLAYLVPIIQALKAQELLYSDFSSNQEATTNNPLRKPKRPRAIILAPTRELALQIASVLKSLSHTIKLSSMCIIGGEDYGKQKKRLNKPLDILVATPGRLVKHWDDGNVYMGSTKFIVVDEVDTMLEQGFQEDIGKVLHPLLYKHKGAFNSNKMDIDTVEAVEGAPQIIITSATMTNAVQRLLRGTEQGSQKKLKKKQMPNSGGGTSDHMLKILLPKNMRVLTAPGLHRAVPRLRQVFIDVGNSDKLSLLVDLCDDQGNGGVGSVLTSRDKKEGGVKGLTLVFCNTVSSCRAVQHALTESGMDSLSYHGELNSAARAENLKLFRQAGKATYENNDEEEEFGLDEFPSGEQDDWGELDDEFDDFGNPVPKEANVSVNASIKKKIPKVMICTDIAARGLDVPEVDHVVMFDFPLNPIDYLHRAGRTARGINQQNKDGDIGRAGSGRVSALVAKRDRVLAMAIESAVQRGEPLDGLSSRKTDYLPGSRLNDNGRSSDRSRNERGDRSRNEGGGRGGRSSGRGGRSGRGRGRSSGRGRGR
jgi:superfamily II DNA/RNA helicase